MANGINGNGHGTFKFQNARRVPGKDNPRFIAHDDKRLAVNILGARFCYSMRHQYHSNITEYTHNRDDTPKNRMFPLMKWHTEWHADN